MLLGGRLAQQFTYGVVSEGFFCGNSAEICRRYVLLHKERVRKFCGKFAEISLQVVRAARLQNETAPEKILNRYEKRFEKREKGSEKRCETRLKNF